MRTRYLRIHTPRNLAHFGGQFGWFFTIGTIPLIDVFAMEFNIPMWTVILAFIFLGERLTFARVLTPALGFSNFL